MAARATAVVGPRVRGPQAVVTDDHVEIPQLLVDRPRERSHFPDPSPPTLRPACQRRASFGEACSNLRKLVQVN